MCNTVFSLKIKSFFLECWKFWLFAVIWFVSLCGIGYPVKLRVTLIFAVGLLALACWKSFRGGSRVWDIGLFTLYLMISSVLSILYFGVLSHAGSELFKVILVFSGGFLVSRTFTQEALLIFLKPLPYLFILVLCIPLFFHGYTLRAINYQRIGYYYTLGAPNTLSFFLGVSVLLLLFQELKSKLLYFIRGVFLIIGSILLVITFSRSGTYGLFFSMFFLFVFYPKVILSRYKLIMVWAAVFVVIFLWTSNFSKILIKSNPIFSTKVTHKTIAKFQGLKPIYLYGADYSNYLWRTSGKVGQWYKQYMQKKTMFYVQQLKLLKIPKYRKQIQSGLLSNRQIKIIARKMALAEIHLSFVQSEADNFRLNIERLKFKGGSLVATSGRSIIWLGLIKKGLENPSTLIFGNGPGFIHYKSLSKYDDVADSIIFQGLYSYGIPGFLFAIFFLMRLFFNKRASDPIPLGLVRVSLSLFMLFTLAVNNSTSAGQLLFLGMLIVGFVFIKPQDLKH